MLAGHLRQAVELQGVACVLCAWGEGSGTMQVFLVTDETRSSYGCASEIFRARGARCMQRQTVQALDMGPMSTPPAALPCGPGPLKPSNSACALPW